MKPDQRLHIISKYAGKAGALYDPGKCLLGRLDLKRYKKSPEYLEKYFDLEKIGRNSLHSYRESIAWAYFLLFSGRDQAQANAVINAVLAAQVMDESSAEYGMLRWFLEEKRIRDRNGNFFIGAVMLLIYCFEREKLTAGNKAGVEKALKMLFPVFEKEKKSCSLTYVNPTMC